MIGATPPSYMCRGANRLPGKAPAAGESLRPPPWKALFLRRETQTFHPEKPYFSVEGRKPFAGESARSFF